MSREGKTYTIATVADFLLVPDDRLDLCLKEFAVMLRMTRAADDLVNAVLREMIRERGEPTPDAKIALVQLVPSFEWTDDDLGNVELTILTSDEPDTRSPAEAQFANARPGGGPTERPE